MQYEDLRSYYFRYHNYVTQLLATIAKHERTIKTLEDLRDRLVQQVAELKQQLKETEEENEKLIQEKIQLKQDICNLEADL